MSNTTLWNACCFLLIFCCSASAQERESLPPEPATGDVEALDSKSSAAPRRFVENDSPASFGAAIIAGSDGRLLVEKVTPLGPAALAGLTAGDVIVSIDGQLITQPPQFYEYLAAHPAEPLRAVVLREGVEKVVELNRPAERPADSASRPALGVRFLQESHVVLGEIVAGSPAEQAGLLPGDRIIAVNSTPISSSDHFINLVTAMPIAKPVDLTIVRGSERMQIVVHPATWGSVFGAVNTSTALKPVVAEAPRTAAVTSNGGPGWYHGYVSPVGVPLIMFPSYYGALYGYTYWHLPAYPACGGYYFRPNWYIDAWPRLAVPVTSEPVEPTGT